MIKSKLILQTAVAVVFSALVGCGSGTDRAGVEPGQSAYAKFENGVGTLVTGESLPAGPDSGFKNVIGETIAFDALRKYATYDVRALLPHKLSTYKWDHALLFIHIEAVDGTGREPFAVVLMEGVRNDHLISGTDSELGFSFRNFGDGTDLLTDVGAALFLIPNILTGGALGEFVLDGRSGGIGTAEDFRVYRPEVLSPPDGSGMRLLHEGFIAGERLRFDADYLKQMQTEHGFTQLRVRQYLISAVVIAERPYDCKERIVSRPIGNGEYEAIREDYDCKTWQTYQNPPEVLAQGGFDIIF